jgi:DNA replication protein DnaC
VPAASRRSATLAQERGEPGLIRTALIIIDDIGLLPVSPDAAEGFYRLVDAAYERRALAGRAAFAALLADISSV